MHPNMNSLDQENSPHKSPLFSKLQALSEGSVQVHLTVRL